MDEVEGATLEGETLEGDSLEGETIAEPSGEGDFQLERSAPGVCFQECESCSA